MIRPRWPLPLDFANDQRIPYSKSWLNRYFAMACALWDHSLKTEKQTAIGALQRVDRLRAPSEDVSLMRDAVVGILDAQEGNLHLDLGESGTGFRFVVALAALQDRSCQIQTQGRLASRPHDSLFSTLARLSEASFHWSGTSLQITPNPTKKFDHASRSAKAIQVEVAANESSQFASALLIASLSSKWRTRQFQLVVKGPVISSGYLDLTVSMLQNIGVSVAVDQKGPEGWTIKREAISEQNLQSLRASFLELKPKLDSSAVATCLCVAAAEPLSRGVDLSERALNAAAEVLDRAQPDAVISKLIPQFFDKTLSGEKLEIDLSGSPDLFPCLAALSRFRIGETRFLGAQHLRIKESDRISGVAELLKSTGVSVQEQPDGLIVHGQSRTPVDLGRRGDRSSASSADYDPQGDHRLAFAAAVLASGGECLSVSNRDCVQKSFPLFWHWLEGSKRRFVICGHRGTGKSSVLSELESASDQLEGLLCYDLDKEISRSCGLSIDRVFEKHGEAGFRKREIEAWLALSEQTRDFDEHVAIAVGGGFDVSQIDSSWEVIWVRRDTDKSGRIFLDRPRLTELNSALEEWADRFGPRQTRFALRADRQLWIEEKRPANQAGNWVAEWFSDELNIRPFSTKWGGGAATLLPNHEMSATVYRWLRWGISRVEVRDDLMGLDRIRTLLSSIDIIPFERLTFSFRDPSRTISSVEFLKSRKSDWTFLHIDCDVSLLTRDSVADPELTQFVAEFPGLVTLSAHSGSAHEGAESLSKARDLILKARLKVNAPDSVSAKSIRLKLAPVVSSWRDLKVFHQWQMQDLQNRFFLPRSSNDGGIWRWYRLWCALFLERSQDFSFWREDDGSSSDQPRLVDWVEEKRSLMSENAQELQHGSHHQPPRFAAVLGSPIHHSWTPTEHRAFFREKFSAPVFAVDLSAAEWSEGIEFLRELGLFACAVTAPLKKRASSAARAASGASGSDPVNTLGWSEERNSWVSTSTDGEGFRALLKAAQTKLSTAPRDWVVKVIGGGGVLKALEDGFQAEQILTVQYLRTTAALESLKAGSLECDLLVVASGRSLSDGLGDVRGDVKLIADLSYTDDSLGRELALKLGAKYLSGALMFSEQARLQREFWTALFESKS